ncbi:MAG: glycine oxidase ThiO [Actinomycetota bacterium]|nr:glycine oxidase ThiO [Actinomycetota bacterium]
MERKKSVAIVGGGITGVAIAYHLAKLDRFEITVIDDPIGRRATGVAAGMLAPVTEVNFGEEHLASFMLSSADYFKSVATTFNDQYKLDIGYRNTGTITVSLTDKDRKDLERYLALYRRLGLSAVESEGSELRLLEPLLSPQVNYGISTEIDQQVDNRALYDALKRVNNRLGVNTVGHKVVKVERDRMGDYRIFNDSGSNSLFNLVIVANGTSSNSIEGDLKEISNFIRPVKGQIIRARHSIDTKAPGKIIRYSVDSRPGYIVTRSNGEVVIGATSEEVGFDDRLKARSTYELLHDAIRVLPIVGEYSIEEINVGFRPASDDNLPIIGALKENLWVALGSYRHGILLSMYIGKMVSEAISAEETTLAGYEFFSPSRFVGDLQVTTPQA